MKTGIEELKYLMKSAVGRVMFQDMIGAWAQHEADVRAIRADVPAGSALYAAREAEMLAKGFRI